MACYHPMPAVRMKDGSVKFVSREKRGVESSMWLSCGQCFGCRLERSRQWAMRCMHEASLHEVNAFVTLTYEPEFLPPGGSLRYRDFQLFMKRLRRTGVTCSYYVGGEYGETFARPHYHACIFGHAFNDQSYYGKSADGSRLYTSDTLAALWPMGFTTVGSVTFASAAYIARYCMKKVNGDLAKAHYEVITEDGEVIDRVPEFNHMSLKRPIGKAWLQKYTSDVYPRDYVVINGMKVKPPKYYDRLFKEENPGVFSELVAQREADAELYLADNSWPRLAVKETVAKARVSFLKRTL